MHDLNRVQLMGHLGHDPEVRYTTIGTARTTFSVATSYRWKDADGQEQPAELWPGEHRDEDALKGAVAGTVAGPAHDASHGHTAGHHAERQGDTAQLPQGGDHSSWLERLEQC